MSGFLLTAILLSQAKIWMNSTDSSFVPQSDTWIVSRGPGVKSIARDVGQGAKRARERSGMRLGQQAFKIGVPTGIPS
jgi:hypothetical protein